VSGPTTIAGGGSCRPLRAEAELRFTIPSTPAALTAAVRIVRTNMEWMAFERDWVFRAELCLHEALLNALFHGNQGNARREIRVGCSLAPENVELEVEDQGSGYRGLDNWNPPPDCEHHGRGLYLIQQYMTSVTTQRNGARIVMRLNKE
jgi:anti-sigma regulatory factor (Ser/Thr protein kinase)